MPVDEKDPEIFGEPIQFHTRSPEGDKTGYTRLGKPIISKGRKWTGWTMVKEDDKPSGSTSAPAPPREPTPPITEPPKRKHKRKFEVFNVNDLPDSMFGPTLKPNKTPSFHSYAPVASSSGTVPYGSTWAGVTVDNNRSNNPSDREIALEEKREKERVRLRAEAAAAKKHKKPGPKRRVSNNVTASASRNTSPAPDIETPTIVNPTITYAEPRGMKRTRSAGGAISAVLAHALGPGSVNVSSPLKAVTGPNTPEELDTKPVISSMDVADVPVSGEPRRGRSRLSGESNSPPDQKTDQKQGRKANSHSPTTNTIPLIPERAPNTLPTTSTKPLSRKGSLVSTDMRRVVSASNIDRKAPAAPEGVRERSRREVILPGRLRDYDVKAGTTT